MSGPNLFDGLRIPIDHLDWSTRRMTKPVASGRCDTEDFRPRTIVRHGFLFDRIDVSRDHASVDVEPQLALVDSADATEADLALANLAVPRARGAHDLVRPFDGLPQFRDLAHCLARRLADIEDFLLRNHRPGTLPLSGQNTLRVGYRIVEERKCSQPFPMRGSFPVFVMSTFPPEEATFPLTV